MACPQSAIPAALEVARVPGVRCDDPVVLSDAWHVLLHLRPQPIVARVSSCVPFPQGPDPDDVVRALAVAGHAARGGPPVTPPTDAIDPGPHRHGGHIVTFWRHVERHGELDARGAGRGLRLVHEAPAHYEGGAPRAGRAA